MDRALGISLDVVVSGGSGFIGRPLVARLKENGHRPRVMDRMDGYDVQDEGACRQVIAKADAVIHLAGLLGTDELFDQVHEAIDVNIHGTVNVLDACLASGAQYVGISMPKSGWANIYTATKHCAVGLAEAYRRHRGLSVSHVVAYNAYGEGQAHGPGHPRKIIPTFAVQSWMGRPIEIWGDGLQTVDLVHVDDIARMMGDAIRFGDGEVFDAGTGIGMTVVEIADRVRDITGSTTPHMHLPMRRGEDPRTEIAATGAGWDLLDWQPTFDEAKFERAVCSYLVKAEGLADLGTGKWVSDRQAS